MKRESTVRNQYAGHNIYDQIAGLASIDAMSYDSQIEDAIKKAIDLSIQGFSIAPEGEGMRATAIRDFLQNALKIYRREGKKRAIFQELQNVVMNAKTMSKLLAAGKTAADPSKVAVKAWMKKHVAEHADPKTGEVNMTSLAEEAAGEFDKKDLGGWLDDETHWIWDAAQEVAEAHEKSKKKATSSDQYEIGAKLIENGANGKLTASLAESVKKIEDEFKDAERVLKKHIQMGVGRTESPALLLRPLREMRALQRTLDRMIQSALHNTGSREGDL